MLRLGPKRNLKSKKQPAKEAPSKAKGKGLKVGDIIVCAGCGQGHPLVPCDNPAKAYKDWFFYYCGGRLKLAQCTSLDGRVLGPFVEIKK